MNAPLQNDIRTSQPTDAGKGAPAPTVCPDYAKYPLSEVNPSLVASVLAFLGGLSANMLVAVVTILGVVAIGVQLARAGPDLPVLGVVGADVVALILAAIAVGALARERKRKNAPHCQKCTDGAAQPGDG
jgi:hypothetical protein